MRYSGPSAILMVVVGLIIASGVFTKDKLWIGAMLYAVSVIIVFITLAYGARKVWKELFNE